MTDPTDWNDLNGAQRKIVRGTLRAAYNRRSFDTSLDLVAYHQYATLARRNQGLWSIPCSPI